MENHVTGSSTSLCYPSLQYHSPVLAALKVANVKHLITSLASNLQILAPKQKVRMRRSRFSPWVFRLNSCFLLPRPCQNRMQIPRPVPGLLKDCSQGRPSHRAAVSVNTSLVRGLRAWLRTPEKNTLLGLPPWFSHQNDDVPG